jgi:Porin subfamily
MRNRGFPHMRMILLGSTMLIAAPAFGDELGELKRRVEELELRQKQAEQAPPVPPSPAPAAAIPGGPALGAFVIPGTNTTLKVGGYVKLDAIYDAGPSQGDLTAPAKIPLNAPGAAGNAARRTDVARLHARESRLVLDTSTPSDYGAVRSYFEGDFFGVNGGTSLGTNSYNFRLRRFFVDGAGFRAGQDYTNFMDLDDGVEVIDFNGPTGQIFIRQAQLRYTTPTTPYGMFAVAIENPEGDFFGANNPADGNISTNVRNPVPDFTARWALYRDNWHIALAGLARELQFDTGATGVSRPSAFGYGLSFSGDIHGFWGKDRWTYQIAGGDGIGRYLNDNALSAGVGQNVLNTGAGQGVGASLSGATTNTPDIAVQAAYGGFTGYQHWWTDSVRSNFIVGYQHDFTNKLHGVPIDPNLPTGNNRVLETFHVNLIWSPLPNANIGIEYIHATRDTTANLSGSIDRVQGAVKYIF